MADSKKGDAGCVLYEIEQFICNYDGTKVVGRVHCYPVPRIFRQCPGRPVVEITALSQIDSATGELTLPENFDNLPKGKLWQDITSHADANKTS
ncbi:hypothetical protein M422DRAFT_262435 [Sphaerobolus stellatus SS14]|uniref:Uncharacterized protein n=1 Tax=Sphaerobolus stellatus (strain SS14) TaxID=990650 RepID=A0A0C9UK72_SPHS4|nr:hypothetical protein M422DRAFT_262435 [Sphaerobolus stellatus SS14]